MAGKFKHLSTHIKVKIPKWLAPVHARREVRTLINEQTFWGQRKPGSFEGIDRDCFRLVSCEAVPKHPDELFIVKGIHFSVPGLAETLHRTLDGAKARALELTNLLREHVELPPETDPRVWHAAMEAARVARAEQMGYDDTEDLADYPGDDGWVTITSIKVRY